MVGKGAATSVLDELKPLFILTGLFITVEAFALPLGGAPGTGATLILILFASLLPAATGKMTPSALRPKRVNVGA